MNYVDSIASPGEMAAFLAEYQKLPDPGGYVTRHPSPPCVCCGVPIFEVVHCHRMAKMADGTIKRWETVDVQCPRCPLETARTVTKKRSIGTFDTATGRLSITGGAGNG